MAEKGNRWYIVNDKVECVCDGNVEDLKEIIESEMKAMLILLEGLVMCFILLIYLVIGIANGPEKFTVFYEKDVQDRAIEKGYTTKAKIKKQTIISIIVLYLPCFILVPFMVCYVNGAKEFNDILVQNLLIMYIMGMFDRFFVDWYWVEHTKAWDIPGTEDLKPYIPKKMKIIKWIGTIIIFPIIALINAWVMVKFL